MIAALTLYLLGVYVLLEIDASSGARTPIILTLCWPLVAVVSVIVRASEMIDPDRFRL